MIFAGPIKRSGHASKRLAFPTPGSLSTGQRERFIKLNHIYFYSWGNSHVQAVCFI